MKKLAIILLAFTFVAPTYAKIVFGKVNIQQIITTVKQGKNVRAKLQGVFDSKQKVIKSEQEKIKKMQEDYQKQKTIMSADVQRKKEQEMQRAMMQLQQKTVGYQREIQEMEAKLKKPILERVKKVVETVSKQNKVDVVFEVSMTPIVYAKSEVDLTKKVIKLYNQKYPVKSKKK